MPKTIILMRHAKAVPEGSMDDFIRPLSEIGKQDALSIGKKLCEHKIYPNYALVSPSTRTRETVAGLQSSLSISTIDFVPSIYLATAEDMLSLITLFPDNIETAIVIAHNPGVAELVFNLINPLQKPMVNAHKFLPATTVILQWPSEHWHTPHVEGKCTLIHIFTESRL